MQAIACLGDTEVSFFAEADPDDLLRVVDVHLIKQECTYSTVEMDDADIESYFNEMVDVGLQPKHFARIWCHTEPGDKTTKGSGTDNETFDKQFGACDWSVMFILAPKSGDVYARLRINAALGVQIVQEIPVFIDYAGDFAGVTPETKAAWFADYEARVTKRSYTSHGHNHYYRGSSQFGASDTGERGGHWVYRNGTSTWIAHSKSCKCWKCGGNETMTSQGHDYSGKAGWEAWDDDAKKPSTEKTNGPKDDGGTPAPSKDAATTADATSQQGAGFIDERTGAVTICAGDLVEDPTAKKLDGAFDWSTFDDVNKICADDPELAKEAWRKIAE